MQLVWEAVVNLRLHERRDLATAEALARWCAAQTRLLFDLIVMPTARQFERPQSLWRRYFADDEGAAAIAAARDRGLDAAFGEHLQPQFVDASTIDGMYGSVEACLRRLGSLYRPLLDELAGHGLGLERLVAERMLTAPHRGLRLAGRADFLADEGRDGYWLLDGKYRLGGSAEVGQLYFYALMIEATQGVRAGWLGFIDYGQARLVPAGNGSFDPAAKEDLLHRIAAVAAGTRALVRDVAALSDDRPTFSFHDIPSLELRPGPRNCAFCSVRIACFARRS